MSIGGGISDALDLAVNAGTKAGLHISVAAGNDNADACQYSPARATGPITIGASNIRDEKLVFLIGVVVLIYLHLVKILNRHLFGPTPLLCQGLRWLLHILLGCYRIICHYNQMLLRNSTLKPLNQLI